MYDLPLPPPPFNDGRGQFPDAISANVPVGMRGLIRDAARKEGVPVAEFVRRALAARVQMFRYAETIEPPRPDGAVFFEG